MAISAALEEYLKTLPAETQAAARKLCEDNPGLGEGWLRQSDYDRSMNENKSKLEEATKWKEWADRNVPLHEQTISSYKDLKAKYDQLLADKGGDMSPEQIAEVVTAEMKKAGLDPAKLSDTQLAATVETIVKTQATAIGEELEKKFLQNTMPASMEFMGQVFDHQRKFEKEFGKELSRKEFVKFIADGKFEKVEDAYAKFTETARLEKKAQDDVEKARQEEREKLANQNLPGSSSLPATVVSGPVADFVNKSAPKPAEGEKAATPGLSPALAAAAELRAAGKV